jgi:acyl-CoA thioester hydrolase
VGQPFRHRIRVRWNECDLQGVVFYANYLMYFDIAMTELWREAVEPFGDMNATGADMVVAEAQIAYRASARFDDELDLVASVLSMGDTSLTTALSVERMPAGEVLAEGTLRHVFVEPETLRKRAIPDTVRGGLQRHLADAPQPA